MERLAKIGLGLGLLWYGVLRGAKGLSVRIQSYSFRSVDLSAMTASLNLNLSIKNPLLVGLTIKGIQGDVYAQGEKVGTVNTSYDYYLAGGKTHVLPVVVNLDLTSSGQAALLNIQSGDVSTLTIMFDGKLFVGKYNVGIPLKFELDYSDLTE